MILVTAANGRTGRSMVRALVGAGHPVRAFDHNPRVEELLHEGAAEAVVGDLLEPRDVSRAVKGARCVVHIGPPLNPREADMGHNVVSAARASGTQHFVQFSVTHPQLEPLLNHQAKLSVERVVLLSRMPFTILQPMHYMQNIDIVQVVAQGVLRQPYAIDTPLQHVDLEDVAEVAAKVVGEGHRHYYATYELCGDDYRTARELAAIISAECGREVIAEELAFSGLPAGKERPSEAEDYRSDALSRLFEHYGRYGITGNPNILEWLLGRRPATFAEYVRRSLTRSA